MDSPKRRAPPPVRKERVAGASSSSPVSGTRSEPKVSAAVVIDQWHLAEEMIGKDVVAAAVAGMSESSRTELAELLPMSWCTLTTSTELHFALARAARVDPHVWHRKLVRLGMERTFTTFWRFLMRLTTVEALVKRATVVYSKSYDRGSAVCNLLGPGVAELVITGWPDIPDFEIEALVSGTEAMLHIAGRPTSVVEGQRIQGGARILVHFPE